MDAMNINVEGFFFAREIFFTTIETNVYICNHEQDATRPHSIHVSWRLLYNIIECGLFDRLISGEISQTTSSLVFSTQYLKLLWIESKFSLLVIYCENLRVTRNLLSAGVKLLLSVILSQKLFDISLNYSVI